MLDDIRDLLNRDLAAHGRVQGLPTEYLVRSLSAKGLTLEVSQSLGRFPANVSWYRESLRVNPDSPHASEAMFNARPVYQGNADRVKPVWTWAGRSLTTISITRSDRHHRLLATRRARDL